MATAVRPYGTEANLQPMGVPTKPGVHPEAPGTLPSNLPAPQAPANNIVADKDLQSGGKISNYTNNVNDDPRTGFHGDEARPNHPRTGESILTARNEKAEAIMEAHKERVEVEANAYLQSEMRKVNARAHTAQALAEKKRMHEEAKAIELKKREELRAEQLQMNAEAKADKIMTKAKEETLKVAVKADKIVENAKQEAARMMAHANEQTERAIADAGARAERDKAAEEEARKTGIAELADEVEQMKATGELPVPEKKGVMTRLKEKVTGHH